MSGAEIDRFYDQHVNVAHPGKQSFAGHFDFLWWKDLQKDLLACERLQRKPFYKIALLKGEAVYESKDQTVAISGYTIVFTSPLTRFSFKTTDTHFDGKYCVCSESFMRGTGRVSLMNWPVFRDKSIYTKSLNVKQYDELLQLFNEIEKEYQSDYPFKEELTRNRVFDIIHYTQKLDTGSLEIRSVPDESLENRFLKMLDHAFIGIRPEMPLEDKSPAYFAQLLYTSVDHLNRMLKKTTGKTTLSLIHERIIEEANILLKHTAYSVKEIAWCLHFQETAHFQNFYKKHTGITPLEYRNA